MAIKNRRAAIVCVGAEARSAFTKAETLHPSGQPIEIDALLRRASEHEFGRLAIVVPATGSWPLPVYELALLAERRARELSLEVRISIITPEPEPLIVFGRLASDAVASLLAVRGIEVRTSARAREEAEISRYETLLTLKLDENTAALISEILAVERNHAAPSSS